MRTRTPQEGITRTNREGAPVASDQPANPSPVDVIAIHDVVLPQQERIGQEGDFQQSNNYNGTDVSAGNATLGWRIEDNGAIEALSLHARGTITATSFSTGVPNDRRINISTGDAGLIEFWQAGQTANPGRIQAITSSGSPALDVGISSTNRLLFEPTLGAATLKASADIFLLCSTVTVGQAGSVVKLDGSSIEHPAGTSFHDDSWTSVSSWFNSWGNFGGGHQNARYKFTGGQVEIQGTISGGTITTKAFTLPTIYRPAATLMFPSNTNDAIGRVQVQSNGDVVVSAGSNVWVSLNISYTPG